MIKMIVGRTYQASDDAYYKLIAYHDGVYTAQDTTNNNSIYYLNAKGECPSIKLVKLLPKYLIFIPEYGTYHIVSDYLEVNNRLQEFKNSHYVNKRVYVAEIKEEILVQARYYLEPWV